jgi:hypothetical protein
LIVINAEVSEKDELIGTLAVGQGGGRSMPASRVANSKKSNKFPSAKLLKKRKENIVSYWEALINLENAKFKKEAETLLVLPEINW